jgi:hypothetical protein
MDKWVYFFDYPSSASRCRKQVGFDREQKGEKKMPTPKFFIAQTTTKYFETEALNKKFNALAKDPGISALSARLVEDGYKPLTKGDNAYFGVMQVFKGNSGETATFEMSLQSYGKPASKDTAAIAMVKISSGKDSEAYKFSLVAPSGNFEKHSEFFVDASNRIRVANSFLSRWKACLQRACLATCLGSLVTCSGTWAAYLGCVAAVCGSCATVCAACASCKCKWWCKWIGCCH